MSTETALNQITPQALASALAAVKPRHWLLDSILGRGLLKDRLNQLAPSLRVSKFEDGYEYDAVLDLLIDDMGMRDLARPATLRDRIAYFREIGRLILVVREREQS